MFKKFQKGDVDTIHPNLRAAVFIITIIHSGEAEYNTIIARYHEALTVDERNTCLRVLGRAKSPELIKRTLGMALSGEVKIQDIYMLISSL
jgi:aminopeptidase 2